MNPCIHATVRDSSPAEVEALHQVCQQLAGFNPNIHLEWVDGFLTSLAAGPQVPGPETWLPALCGDAFDRAFADPADRQRAQRTLHTRLKVLCEQLNPEKLLDSGETLRLAPLMMEWTDADRERLLQEGTMTAEDLPVVKTGAEWALGFIDGTEAFAEAWLGPLEETADGAREELLDQLVLMFMPADEPERAELLAKYHPATEGAEAPPPEPLHEDLITEALFAAQDLRIFWLDHAPKASTRRVQAEPGRNEPCPCGSGKKYKKCHGAAVAE